MPKIRVLVVEDSMTVQARLVEVLGADAGIEVVGQVADGKSAIDACHRLRPDVMTLDMMLPVMSGVAVTEYVMAHIPLPILIVSASTNRGELFRTYDALAAGAVDVLDKPTGREEDGDWEARLVAAVKLVARIKVITHLRLRMGSPRLASPAVPAAIRAPGKGFDVLAIGASTGGPAAIVEVLKGLPNQYPIPILLVLHIGEPFGAAFADWLDGQTSHRVSFARDDEPFAAIGGRIVMAPPNRHLSIHDGKLRLDSGPERHSCRPSVDVLFESVARNFRATGAGCLLTGMGRDGAAGLLEIRRAGGRTVAQDEATSVVYGMPREAVQLGAAERILPLREIGPALALLASASRGKAR